MRYYIADCHFFHERLNTVMDCRGFTDVEASNEYMIRRWNETIDPDKLTDYTVLTPGAEEFYALFKDYRRNAAAANAAPAEDTEE